MGAHILTLANHSQAQVLRVSAEVPAADMIECLAIPAPRGVLVLNGGTADLGSELIARLGPLLQDGLARVAAEERLTVVTGGTAAGVFALFGAGLARWEHHDPCIGVAVAALVAASDAQAATLLEPHHSHFVLVEGDDWGDETTTMYTLVNALAATCPSVAVFANGGQIVLNEMHANVRQGRPMIIIAGSGRSADAVLAAHVGQSVTDPRMADIAARGSILSFAIDDPPAALRQLVRRTLFATGD